MSAVSLQVLYCYDKYGNLYHGVFLESLFLEFNAFPLWVLTLYGRPKQGRGNIERLQCRNRGD